jgi:hypothetical protein
VESSKYRYRSIAVLPELQLIYVPITTTLIQPGGVGAIGIWQKTNQQKKALYAMKLRNLQFNLLIIGVLSNMKVLHFN